MDKLNQIGQDLLRYKDEPIFKSQLTQSLRSGVGREPSTRPPRHISISSQHYWEHKKNREMCAFPSTVPGPQGHTSASGFSKLWFLASNRHPAGRGGLQRSSVQTFCSDSPNHVQTALLTEHVFYRRQFGKLPGYVCIPVCTHYSRICGKLHLMQKTHLSKVTY